MAVFIQPIFTQSASGSATSITFNNIPQGFTDLKLVMSTRNARSAILTQQYVRLNGDENSVYSDTFLFGIGSGTSQAQNSNSTYFNTYAGNGSTSLADTFSSCEIYIPNYTNNQFKSIIVDAVAENNSSSIDQSRIAMGAALWRNTAAITSIGVFDFFATNFSSGSTFSLYGILRQGV